MAEGSEERWSYLDASAQPQGPFPISYLQSTPRRAGGRAGALGSLAAARSTAARTDLGSAELCSRGAAVLAGLQQAGYFNSEAMFWREGQPEWKPLKELPELFATLQQPPPAGAAAAAEGEEEEEEGNGAAAPRPAPTKAGGRGAVEAAPGWWGCCFSGAV